MDNYWVYISPFLSAGLASYITYTLTLRSKRYEIFLKEIIESHKALQRKIISLKKYCMSVILDYGGDEFSPRYEEDIKSALAHRAEISSVIEDNSMFYSEDLLRKYNNLDSQLSLLCNFELLKASNWSGFNEEEKKKMDNTSGYDGTLRDIELCLKQIQIDLKIPDEFVKKKQYYK